MTHWRPNLSSDEYAERLKQTLAANRNRPINHLIREIPIQSLIDSDYCLQASNEIHDTFRRWEKFKVNPDVALILPDRNGVYMFCWEPPLYFHFEEVCKSFDWCLYVGKAENTTIRGRFESEYRNYVSGDPKQLFKKMENPDRKERLAKYFCLQPLSIWCLPVDDKQLIPDLEDKLIDLLNPPLNKQKSLRGKLCKSEQAF